MTSIAAEVILTSKMTGTDSQIGACNIAMCSEDMKKLGIGKIISKVLVNFHRNGQKYIACLNVILSKNKFNDKLPTVLIHKAWQPTFDNEPTQSNNHSPYEIARNVEIIKSPPWYAK